MIFQYSRFFLEEIRADIPTKEEEAEGLLDELLAGGTKMKPARQRKKTDALAKPEALLTELRELILNVRSQVAQTVNVGLTMLYWQVGDRILRETLKEQ